jgi:hypothetical protein
MLASISNTERKDAIMGIEDEHPSQAEGEDPQRPPSGEDAPEHDHPSQAEGEDMAGDSESADTGSNPADRGGTPEEG